jgi:hypothetical protein
LHITKNPRGKKGLDERDAITVTPLELREYEISKVTLFPEGRELKFEQTGDGLKIHLAGVTPDPVSTIIAVEFGGQDLHFGNMDDHD